MEVEVSPAAALQEVGEMLKKTKRWFLVTPLVVIILYCGIVGWFALNEPRFLYFPSKELVPPLPHLKLAHRQIEIRTNDHIKLACWIIPVPSADPSAVWMIYFHGNGGNVSHGAEKYAQLRDLGLHILAIDYRGYGESEGEPSEPGLYTDADAAYAYVRNVLGVPAHRIVLYGFSLGSAVAIDLATRAEVSGLIVEGAFTSIPDRGQELYPFLPVIFTARNRFASIEKIGLITTPKLFIHAHDDEIIPIEYGRRLYDAAVEPKTFLEVRGGHNDSHFQDPAAYHDGLKGFLTESVSRERIPRSP